MSGWLSLHRAYLEWEWYDDHNVSRVFLHCLLKANYKDKRYKGKVIKRGSFITGRDILAAEVGLSVQSLRTSLDKLKSTSELTIKTTPKGTEIQVNNYEKYQQVTSELTSNQPASNQQVTTTNKETSKQRNNKTPIPPFSKFSEYANTKAKENGIILDQSKLKLKYEAWKEGGWKTGNDKPIKRWKSTLLHTMAYLKKEGKVEAKMPQRLN